MKIEHQLGPVWSEHFRQTLHEIGAHESKAFELEGRATAERRECELKRRHLGQLLASIAAAEKLPESVTPYRLSPDGTKIIGEAKDGASE